DYALALGADVDGPAAAADAGIRGSLRSPATVADRRDPQGPDARRGIPADGRAGDDHAPHPGTAWRGAGPDPAAPRRPPGLRDLRRRRAARLPLPARPRPPGRGHARGR